MRIFVKGSQECPHISHLCLWKRTSDSSRCHKQSRETPDSAATISYLVTFIYSKCNVPWGRPMLSVSRVRSHHTSLPKCMLFWMDEYGHIVVDCPHQIPPSSTPAHHHRQDSNNRHCTRSNPRHHHWDRYRHSRSRLQSWPCRHRRHSHHDSQRGHSRSHHRDSRCYHRSTLQHHFSQDTPHQRPSSHRNSSTHSKDCSRSQSCSTYKPSKKILYKSSSSPSSTTVKSQDRRHPRVMIDDPQTDIYSTDDNSSDSEEDGDHLN